MISPQTETVYYKDVMLIHSIELVNIHYIQPDLTMEMSYLSANYAMLHRGVYEITT
ncbi:hypothetical protein JOC25_000200 [Solibacillus kalamii]|uniref:hypothetical protein n=1 Tax=Solibacillus kalamii TaxID=1748298 RepID=UPI001875F8EF|nr:hypothetical protein [Solibacillus kalamii]MBM7663744.1 hypothetical protein [Solibacillus kalamii]